MISITGTFTTVKEAADVLNIDESLVTRYCRQGRLDAIQISRAWLIRRTSLDEFSRQPRERGNPNFKRSHKGAKVKRRKKRQVAANC